MTFIPTHKDLMKNKKADLVDFVIMEREEVKLLREENKKLRQENNKKDIDEYRKRLINLIKENDSLKEQIKRMNKEHEEEMDKLEKSRSNQYQAKRVAIKEIDRLNSQFNNISNMVDDKIKNM